LKKIEQGKIHEIYKYYIFNIELYKEWVYEEFLT